MEKNSSEVHLSEWKTNLKRIQDGDLYALLSICTDDELEPLVKLITDNWWSESLTKNAAYKRYKPCHRMYHRAIGDEIRLFGGNTWANGFRSSEGPKYDEIVTDVCKKIGIPFKSGQTVMNEEKALNIYLDRQWKGVNRKEQEEIIKDAREKARVS